MLSLCKAFWLMIKSTHRHPVNRALHAVGTPFYVFGLAVIIHGFSGYQSVLAYGALLWIAGTAMFTAGHLVEGNLSSITPVLAFRLAFRKAQHYFAADRIHLQAA
jgi:hypothetical protein